ncbi:putative toxin-antitoxin system toxin component, PIN family [Patescibacteria group bacterium AH-259-L07]|nr:putative toxin-antitoxin system toxin component, PIN family [Patescibacteria group bacterium AH-259-L07]
MRILLDTNILFSALIAEGNEKYLVEKITASYHTIALTDLTIEEIKTVLSKKLSKKSATKAKAILKNIQQQKLFYIKTKDQYKKFIPKAQQLINKKDVPILAAGIQPEIDALVTGDKDFLQNPKLSSIRKKKIFSTKEILLHFDKKY